MWTSKIYNQGQKSLDRLLLFSSIHPFTALTLICFCWFSDGIVTPNPCIQMQFPLPTPCFNVVLNSGVRASTMWINIRRRSYVIIGFVAPAIGPNKSKKLTRLISPTHNTRGKVWMKNNIHTWLHRQCHEWHVAEKLLFKEVTKETHCTHSCVNPLNRTTGPLLA